MIASDYTLEYDKKQYAGYGLAVVLILTNLFNLSIFLKESYTQLKLKIQMLRKRMLKGRPEPKIAYKIPLTVTQSSNINFEKSIHVEDLCEQTK